jgi:transcriptional regulator with XRE-family HTH domain
VIRKFGEVVLEHAFEISSVLTGYDQHSGRPKRATARPKLTGGCMAPERQQPRPDELLQFVPATLKLMRQGTGLRQTDVSLRSGLTKAMLSAYEKGKTLPNLTSLTAFLVALGKDFSDFQEVLDMVRKVSPKRSPDDRDLEREVGQVVLRAIQDVIKRQAERDS